MRKAKARLIQLEKMAQTRLELIEYHLTDRRYTEQTIMTATFEDLYYMAKYGSIEYIDGKKTLTILPNIRLDTILPS